MRVRGSVIVVSGVALVGLLAWSFGRLSGTSSPDPARVTPLSLTAPQADGRERLQFPDGPGAQALDAPGAEAESDMPSPLVADAAGAESEQPDPAAPLEVAVIDAATEAPVAGARITLVARDLTDQLRTIAVLDGVSDSDGRWAVKAPLGQLEISAETDGGAFGRGDVIHEGADARRIVKVSLAALTTLRGIVVDNVSSAPIAGATVSGWHGSATKSVTTDAGGRFEFPYWIVGVGAALSVSAAGDGRATPMVFVDPEKGGWMLLQTDAGMHDWKSGDPFLELRLDPAQLVRGRVELPDGRAVPGVKVHAIGYITSFVLHAPDAAEAVTDAEGGFELAGLQRAIPHLVFCDDDPLRSGVALAASGGGAQDVGSIVLRPTATVVGRAVDSAGRPLGGARVDVRVSDFSSQLLASAATLARSIEYGRTVGAQVEADGRFSVAGVAGSTATLSISLGSFGREQLLRRILSITPGTVNDVGRCESDTAVERVRGALSDAGGHPLARTQLVLLETGSGSERSRTTTLDDGRYDFALVRRLEESDMLLVAVDDRGRTTARWHATLDENSPTLRITP